MSSKSFDPTAEQLRVIHHRGSAFVSACPGAGKTRVLVERARTLSESRGSARGVAFLSFTNAAVSELEARLRHECLLGPIVFPNFIGTFDGFIWQFFVAPFGVPGCDRAVRLIPDKGRRGIATYPGGRELPLECFDRSSGDIISTVASRYGFDASENPRVTKAYIKAALAERARLLERGEVDFDDARALAAAHIENATTSPRLAAALKARFGEVIVDEAQDCDPADLSIIRWLKKSGIATKVICDPHQSIFGFRGGVGGELSSYSQEFGEAERLPLSGNFRSSAEICRAIVALRPIDARSPPDQACGPHADIKYPVHLLSYGGTSVPPAVGEWYRELVADHSLDLTQCPILAATRASVARAIGQPADEVVSDLSIRLAAAVTTFHFSFEAGDRKRAIEEVHRVVLAVEDRLGDLTYHQYLTAHELQPGTWRPRMLQLVRELRYDGTRFPTADDWLGRAKELLAPHLPAGEKSISQRLRRNAGLAAALGSAPVSSAPPRTIHSVKGLEFPAVCVVMTSATAKGIVDYLTTGSPPEVAEDARKIYVAASRAQQLLAIAVPKSQAKRLDAHLRANGATVRLAAV